MTNGKIISKQEAYGLAIGFLPEIHGFIEQNKNAYIEYLKATSQIDEQYYNPNISEAENERKCG